MTTIGYSETFWFNKDDFQPDLLQTPERQKKLQAFVAKLKAEGWKPAGHGESWYSYRFSPVSVSSGPDPRNQLTPEQQEILNRLPPGQQEMWEIQMNIINQAQEHMKKGRKNSDAILHNVPHW